MCAGREKISQKVYPICTLSLSKLQTVEVPEREIYLILFL